MKKNINLILLALLFTTYLSATQTTYTFIDKSWSSKVGTVKTDVKTDGWISNLDGLDYYSGYGTEEMPRQVGVHITTSCSNAGATSVLEFQNVRKVIFNYATGSKTKGSITMTIGGNESVTLPLVIPAENKDANRDLEFTFQQMQSGKITFSVECTKNPIYLNSITIKAENGSPNITGLTAESYELVTNVNDLKDGDNIIFGVKDPNYNYVMGVYDEYNSRNNIYAVKAVYDSERQTVNEVADAIYILHIDNDNGVKYFAFEDYTNYYLVASGGNPTKSTNNYLTVWDDVYSDNYGNYGWWNMTINESGEATIVNCGRSASNKLQFNPNGTTPIFSCYKDFTQKPVALYRKVIIENPTEPYIKVPLINFGTQLIEKESVSGSKQVLINAVNLTQTIDVELKDGTVFSVDKTTLDQDGEELTLSFTAFERGKYIDTLILTSGEYRKEVSILLNVEELLTIEQAKQLPDLSECWLKDVVVTKKYNMYIFVQDETGALMLFDSGNLYGSGVKTGDVLSGVNGKFKYYYQNPQITLNSKFEVSKSNVEIEPFEQTANLTLDDACKLIKISSTHFNQEQQILVGNQWITLDNKFNIGLGTNLNTEDFYDVVAIAYYYNEMQLWPISITRLQSTDIETTTNSDNITNIYSIMGQQLDNISAHGIYIIQNDKGQRRKVVK